MAVTSAVATAMAVAVAVVAVVADLAVRAPVVAGVRRAGWGVAVTARAGPVQVDPVARQAVRT